VIFPRDGTQPQDHVLLLAKAAGIVLDSCVERLQAQLEGAAALTIPQALHTLDGADPPTCQAVEHAGKLRRTLAGR
jgi:hypothetical protein